MKKFSQKLIGLLSVFSIVRLTIYAH